MIKQLTLLFAFILLSTGLWAQAPQQFKFQAVARDAAGNPYVSANLGIRVSIVRDGASGLIDFSERHSIISSPLGVFDLAIGNGAALLGTMTDLDWANYAYYLKIDIDPNGGTDYLNLGSSQLLSVPYAIYAGESGSGSGGTDSQTISYDPDTHELSISNGNTIILPEGGQGPQGEQGSAGEQGEQGAAGSPGADGEPGIQGEQGIAGTGISLLGNVPTVDDLPAGAAQGDLYIVQADGNGYVWDGSEWNNVGPIQGPQGEVGPSGSQGIQGELGSAGLPGEAGPQGEQGEQGIAGSMGVQGAQGIQGETGSQGVAGPAGAQGITGPTGSQGEQGAAGTGINLLGNVATVGDLPAGANQGDLYIVQADGNGYAWDGSEWNNVGPIQGPQGETGANGVQGEQGIQGITGIIGTQGEQGIQGVAGTMGLQGDAGLPGETGTQGTQGEQGNMGETGFPGEAGPQGEQGIAGPQGEQGIQGEQGSGGAYTAGAGIAIAGDEISATDSSPINEIQTLELEGTELSLSSSGGSVDLSSLPSEISLPYYNEADAPSALFHIHNQNTGSRYGVVGTTGVDNTFPENRAGVLGIGDNAHGVLGVSKNGFLSGVSGYSESSTGVGVSGFGFGGGTGGHFYTQPGGRAALATSEGKVGFGTRDPTDKVEIMDDTQTRLSLNSMNSEGRSSLVFKNLSEAGPEFGWAMNSSLTDDFQSFTLDYNSDLSFSTLAKTAYRITKSNALPGTEFLHFFHGDPFFENSLYMEAKEEGSPTTSLRMRPVSNPESLREFELRTEFDADENEASFEINYHIFDEGAPFEFPKTLYKITSYETSNLHSFKGVVEIDGTNGGLSSASRLEFHLNQIGEAQHVIHMGAEAVDDQAMFSLFETTGFLGNFLYHVASDPTYTEEGLGGFHQLFGQTSTNSMVIGELDNMDVHALDFLSTRLWINSDEPNIIGATIANNSLTAPAMVVRNSEDEGQALYVVGKIGINNILPKAWLTVGGSNPSNDDYDVPALSVSGLLPESTIIGGIIDIGKPNGNRITMKATDDFPQVFIKAGSESHGSGMGVIEMQTRQLNIGVNPGINNSRNYPLRIVQPSTGIGYGLNLVRGGNQTINWELTVSSLGDMSLYSSNAYRGQFDVTSGNYSPISDARLKTNIRPLSRILPQLMQLEAKKYEYKSNKGKEYHGFLAQGIQAIFPEVVTEAEAREEGENSTLLVDYAQLTVLSIAAIKELAVQVGEQQETINQQSSDIEALKTQHQADIKSMNASHQSELEAINARLEALEGLLLKD